jgi:hypothetical protein
MPEINVAQTAFEGVETGLESGQAVHRAVQHAEHPLLSADDAVQQRRQFLFLGALAFAGLAPGCE